MTKIAILGGGSWGTALAVVLSRSRTRHDVALWMRDPEKARDISSTRENKIYLPGIGIPESVLVSSSLEDATGGATIIVGAMPAADARAVYTKVLPLLNTAASSGAREDVGWQRIFVSATKGLEPQTHLRISEVIEQVFAGTLLPQIAVLSGPSFALEAARGEPTAVVLAARLSISPQLGEAKAQEQLADFIQSEFAAPSFRIYTNDDVLGVELAGAMKNVIAIAAGACQGLGLGSNAVAALITRGLAEMSRLAIALGARAQTLSGLAGLGDLVLTCTGMLSRNRHVGIELGKGRTLPQILASMKMVAEGVGTAAAVLALAEENEIEMPITAQVEQILHQGKSPRQAIAEIMERPQKHE